MSANEVHCRSKACLSPAAGQSPLTGVALCRTHLDRDIAKVLDQKKRLIERLQQLTEPADRQQLRLEQQMLAAEIQEVEDMFDALQEKVQQWRNRTVSRVQAMHDSVSRRLRDAAEAEECEMEVSVACDAGDMRKVAVLAGTLEPWVDEASERSAEFDRDLSNRQKREDTDYSNFRSVGDVSGGVQQLQFVIDRHMTDVMQQCWLEKGSVSKAIQVCEAVSSIDDLGNKPQYATCCTNTEGFFGDSSGRVVKTCLSGELSVPLPQPCIFVLFKARRADHLLVLSFDGAVRLKCHNSLNWDEGTRGLHCDSARQLLFVAQLTSITVMDLSGSIVRVINASSLEQSISCISTISGNSDKVFVLDKALLKIFEISKETGQLELAFDVSRMKKGDLDNLTSLGRKILLVDWKLGRVLKVCGITGQLIASYPNQGPTKFLMPCQVAVEARGIMLITEAGGHTVRAMSASGQILQTLGVPETAGNSDGLLNWPVGLSVISDGDRQLLVVVDKGNARLCVYHLN